MATELNLYPLSSIVSGVTSVNTKTGDVTLTGEDIKIDSDSPDTIVNVTDDLQTQINTKQASLTTSNLISITGSNNYIDVVYDDDSGLYANGAAGLSIDHSVIQEKLTAGDGITITNNVISATGGAAMHAHSINLAKTNSDNVKRIMFTLYTPDNYNYSSISEFGPYITAGVFVPATGYYKQNSTTQYTVIGVGWSSPSSTLLFMDSDGVSHSIPGDSEFNSIRDYKA